MASPSQTLKRLRGICMSLPDVHETKTFQHETWRIGKKTFAVFEKYNGEWVITFKATPLEQDHLVTKRGYFRAPYVGQHGWVCLVADKANWNNVKSHIVESYRLNALKRQLKKLESLRT